MIESLQKNKVCGFRLSIEALVRLDQPPSASSPKLAIIVGFLGAACPYIRHTVCWLTISTQGCKYANMMIQQSNFFTMPILRSDVKQKTLQYQMIH